MILNKSHVTVCAVSVLFAFSFFFLNIDVSLDVFFENIDGHEHRCFCTSNLDKIEAHPNPLASRVLDVQLRRLKRQHPTDMPFRVP